MKRIIFILLLLLSSTSFVVLAVDELSIKTSEELMRPVLPENIVGTWVASGGTNENTVKSFFKIKTYGIMDVFDYKEKERCYESETYKISPLGKNKYRIFYYKPKKPLDVSLLIINKRLQKTFVNSEGIKIKTDYALLNVSKRTAFKRCKLPSLYETN